jgi:hypothetical protein
MFTARFPDTPETRTLSTANPAALRWGEQVTQARAGGREYAVAVLDGLNAGDQEVGPATRDAQAKSVILLAATNTDGKVVHQRPATHEGHAAQEVLIAHRGDGGLTALRVVVGERSCVRIGVTSSEDASNPDAVLDSAAAFFDTVHLGSAFGPPVLEDPVAVSAEELGAAYQADPKAADARFKDRWVRVTGPVTAVGEDGTTLEMDARGAAIAIRRLPRGRGSVRVQQGGATVTVTGLCQGLLEPATGVGPRIGLNDGVVVRTPTPNNAK